MRSSQDAVITFLDRYDMYAGDKSTPASVQGVSVDFYVHMDFAFRIDLKPVRKSNARFGRILATKDGALNVRCTLRMRCSSYMSSLKDTFVYTGLYYVEFWKDLGQYGCSETPSLLSNGYQGLFLWG
jgi:hypothetical protein